MERRPPSKEAIAILQIAINPPYPRYDNTTQARGGTPSVNSGRRGAAAEAFVREDTLDIGGALELGLRMMRNARCVI